MSTSENSTLPLCHGALLRLHERLGVRFRAFGLCDRRRIGAPDPVRTLFTTETKLSKWLETAWPGERFVYHVGHLAADRAAECSQLRDADREQLQAMARLIMAGVDMGWLIPVQRRRDDGHIEYLAVRVTARRNSRKGAA